MATLVFDTGPLRAFAIAGLLEQLRAITEGHVRLRPPEVDGELSAQMREHPELEPALAPVLSVEWIGVAATDDLPVIVDFAFFKSFLNPDPYDVADAAVLAYCRVHGAIAVFDDRTARQIGCDNRVRVLGSLGLIADGIRRGLYAMPEACTMVDALLGAGAWLPCDGSTFPEFCRKEHLV